MRVVRTVLVFALLVVTLALALWAPAARWVELDRSLQAVVIAADDYANKGSVQAAHVGLYHLASRYPHTPSAMRARIGMVKLRPAMDARRASTMSVLEIREREARSIRPTLDLFPLALLFISVILWPILVRRSRRARRALIGWHIVFMVAYAGLMLVGLSNVVVAELNWVWGSIVGLCFLSIAAFVAIARLLWNIAARVCRLSRSSQGVPESA